MCCVDPRRKQACWVSELTVQERYGGTYHTQVPTRRSRAEHTNDDTPANQVEYGATIDVYAPVDTDAMLANAGFGQMQERITRS